MKTILGNYQVLPKSKLGFLLSYFMIAVIWIAIIGSLSGCGVFTSQGHFAAGGDAQGWQAVSDMINGLAQSHERTNGYWRTRRLQETEKTQREVSPGFLSRLLWGPDGGKPKKQAPTGFGEDIGS